MLVSLRLHFVVMLTIIFDGGFHLKLVDNGYRAADIDYFLDNGGSDYQSVFGINGIAQSCWKKSWKFQKFGCSHWIMVDLWNAMFHEKLVDNRYRSAAIDYFLDIGAPIFNRSSVHCCWKMFWKFQKFGYSHWIMVDLRNGMFHEKLVDNRYRAADINYFLDYVWSDFQSVFGTL